MSRPPRHDLPMWQQPNLARYGAGGLADSQYNAGGNSQHEQHSEGMPYGGSPSIPSARSDPRPPSSYQAPPPPANHGMRICGAAGSELGMRIQGAAGRDQTQRHLSPALPQASMQHDATKLGPASDSWSRSSTRARSSSLSEQQSNDRKPTNNGHILERKDEQIKGQEQFINRLTSENQSLSANVKGLIEAKNRMNQRLEQREKELQQLAYRDPDLSRRRDEVFVDQGRQLQDAYSYVNDLRAQVRRLGELPVPAPGEDFVRSKSTRDLQGIEVSDAGSEDDLDALDFPDASNASVSVSATPVERRIQALGSTLDENDRMEAQQPVVVSRHLRSTKDGDQGSWNRPIGQSKYWQKVKDDPVFAVIGDGPPVSFETLYQRLQDIPSIISVNEDPRYQPARPPDNERDDIEYAEPQYHQQRRLSYDQEERLAALGVSGDPKPVKPYTPKNAQARTRSRSRSPQTLRAQPVERHDYRQRDYESYSPRGQSADQMRNDDRDQGSVAGLDAAMGHEIARNIEAKFGYGQQNQHKRRGKGQGQNKQHQKQQHSDHQHQQSSYQISQNHYQQRQQSYNPHQHQHNPQNLKNSSRSQGHYDRRGNQINYG